MVQTRKHSQSLFVSLNIVRHFYSSAKSLILGNFIGPRLNRVRDAPLFRVLFSTNYHPSHIVASILADPYHIIRSRTASKLSARPRVGLWLQVSCNPLSTQKAVVRVWGEKRTKHALQEEFQARGLNKNGTPLPGTVGKGIYGSLQLLPQKELLEVKFVEVKRQIKILVDWLEDQMEESRYLDRKPTSMLFYKHSTEGSRKSF